MTIFLGTSEVRETAIGMAMQVRKIVKAGSKERRLWGRMFSTAVLKRKLIECAGRKDSQRTLANSGRL